MDSRRPLLKAAAAQNFFSDDRSHPTEQSRLSAQHSCEMHIEAKGKRSRIESVDVLRGVVMILMALDHTRDYFGVPGVSPVNLAQTTVPLFFTRWITHLCAPTFFLLTGTGAYLALGRKSKAELSRFLFTRGLWLLLLEIVLLRCLVWQFNFDYRVTMLVVIWALGWAMICLSALVYLPVQVVTAIGLVIIMCHNLFDGVRANSFGLLAPLWNILHAPGFAWAGSQHFVFVAYPLIPWIGVTAVGYGLGQVYRWEPARRRTFLLRLGIALSAAFLVLRGVNVYGDPVRWTAQKSAALTVLSFLNVNKYPPSLLFLLMTIGPGMLLLWAVDGRTPRFLRPAIVYGSVPMFYYILHAFLLHALAAIICFARYRHVHWMFESPRVDLYPVTPPPGWGFSLPVVYLIWIAVVIALYPLCLWYAGVRRRSNNPWLSYL